MAPSVSDMLGDKRATEAVLTFLGGIEVGCMMAIAPQKRGRGEVAKGGEGGPGPRALECGFPLLLHIFPLFSLRFFLYSHSSGGSGRKEKGEANYRVPWSFVGSPIWDGMSVKHARVATAAMAVRAECNRTNELITHTHTHTATMLVSNYYTPAHLLNIDIFLCFWIFVFSLGCLCLFRCVDHMQVSAGRRLQLQVRVRDRVQI